MKIAAIDVGYINVFSNVYLFKAATLYYIYEQGRLIDKRLSYETSVKTINNSKLIDEYRLELEKRAIEKCVADYVIIDGNLNPYFYSLETEFRKNRYWIPKTLADKEYENEYVIARIFGNENRKYIVETFVENRENLDSFMDVLKQYLITPNIVYPYILHEVDLYSVVRPLDYPVDLYLLRYKMRIHNRIMRDNLTGGRNRSFKRKDLKI